MIEICFVCTGNTCRSVMAERMARKIAKNRNLKDVKFTSAGIFATGEQITQNAVNVLKKLGYDGRPRKSVKLAKTKPNVIYVAVTQNHKQKIHAEKVLCFEEFAGSVGDPYGQSEEVYLQTAKQIEKNVKILIEKIEHLRGEK